MKAIRYVTVLGLICVASAFGVAGTFRLTRERIAEREAADRARAQEMVLSPGAGKELSFGVLNPDAPADERVVAGRDSRGNLVGYAALGEGQGYGGKVRVMVGMDARAERILSVTVVSHQETPGLGSRVAEVKSSKTWLGMLRGEREAEQARFSEFLKQFQGCDPDRLELRPEGGAIQAISGATISSRAVVQAVRQAVEKIRAVRPATGDTTVGRSSQPLGSTATAPRP